MICIHHMQLIIETRNFTIVIFILYTVNFVFFILMIMANNGGTLGPSQIDGYKDNQFVIGLSSPLLYLAVFLSTFIAVVPRYAWKCIEHVVWRPEFAIVNG